MKTMAIKSVTAWEALDSRGSPTVGCEVTLENGGRGRATVPSGASTGRHEAHELRDGDPARYAGLGVARAVSNVRGELAAAVLGLHADEWRVVDGVLCEVDGTPDLARLGANAVLAISLATVQAAADGARTPLYEFMAAGHPELPMPMVNIVSGGAHAGGAIDIQDVLVVPIGAESFAQALEWSRRIRGKTAEVAELSGLSTTLVADEGGLGLPLGSNAAALELVCAGVECSGLALGEQVVLAVDVAANGFFDGENYELASEERSLNREEWLDEVCEWSARFPISSIEDPLAEDDWGAWTEITRRIGDCVQILGDDLFATNQARLQRGIEQNAANAVLLKPNQAGSLSRTEGAWQLAVESAYGTVLSARSGDTEDSWLADIAVAWRTGQIKVGSTTRSERNAKWNRLVEIEARLGTEACLAVSQRGLAERRREGQRRY
jgi:enolase